MNNYYVFIKDIDNYFNPENASGARSVRKTEDILIQEINDVYFRQTNMHK